MIMSTRGVVSSGHYLATEIGIMILRNGGNAMDAAAAVGFALALLKPHQNGIAGEVPMLVYDASEQQVRAISGHGVAPKAATIDLFKNYGLDIIPGDGFLPAIVPPLIGSWILLLERYGTKRLSDVLLPTVEMARRGFPMYDALRDAINNSAERFRKEWETSADVFLPGGEVPPSGSIFKQPQWAETFSHLIDAESKFTDRKEGLRAAYDEFYRGAIAEKIVDFCTSNSILDASGKSHSGLLTTGDFHAFQAKVEDPVTTSYRGIDLFKCSSWTQGPVLLQSLNLLENFSLAQMTHNSAEYIHTIVECMKLAYADREFYYGDPDFVDVPFDILLSKEYAKERISLIDPSSASMELRPGRHPSIAPESIADLNKGFEQAHGKFDGDTTKLEVIDSEGNMVSATQSGAWLMTSPVIGGLGFPLGTRGQMFSLASGHPNSLEPGKRPRTTLTPSLAMKNGKPFMVFGSPGGDCQDQWALESFLNVIEFGMSLQEAVEAPTFWTTHFPGSFYPRKAEIGSVSVESRIPESVRDELSSRGHKVKPVGEWAGGNTLAATIDPETGLRCAAASPRLHPAYAIGF